MGQRYSASLHEPCRNGDVDALRERLAKGGDVERINKIDGAGRTPVFVAAEKAHNDCLRLLLEHGADPNIPDKSGVTPLHATVLSHHLGTMRILLQHGTDATKQDGKGRTPVQIARATEAHDLARDLDRAAADWYHDATVT